jgi:hypothetical protein
MTLYEERLGDVPLGPTMPGEVPQYAMNSFLAGPRDILMTSKLDLDPSNVRDYRRELLAEFSFAILTDAMVQALKQYSPLLEVGSGTGYWAYELRQAGADIVVTDPAPYSGIAYDPTKIWLEPERIDATVAVSKYPGRTLLMVWPSLERPWAHEALEAYEGDALIYVGEGYGGCTADDAFHELLEARWTETQQIDMPQWWGLHDYCAIYRRQP